MIAAVVAAALAAAPAPEGTQPAYATQQGRARLVLLDLSANGVDANSVKTITDVISTAFARYPTLDVVTAGDLRAMMNVEASKQAMSCGAGEACMAEIAAALGADLLVHGSVGKLGDVTIVNLSVFDARKSSAVGREKVESSDPGKLSPLLEGAVDRLAVSAGATSAQAETGGPAPALLWGGVAAAGLGIAVAGVAAVLAGTSFATLEDPQSSGADKETASALYPPMLGVGAVGVVVAVAGAALIGAAFALGD